MNALPKTHTQTLYICAFRSYVSDAYQVDLLTFDPTKGDNVLGRALLGTTEVTIDVPQVNMIEAELTALSEARDSILSEANRKAAVLAERIQRLRCLEHSA
jgi:hypothetical protein